MKMEKLKVLIVEDIKEVREGLRYLLSLDRDITVAGTFGNAENLLEKLSNGLPCDVILMDIGLPAGMDGIEAVKIIKKKYPEINVVMLTVFGEREKILKALRAGASGYVLKNTKPEQLADQIKSIRNGGSPLSPEAASKLLDELKKDDKYSKEQEESDYNLTSREKEILKGIANGYTYREIAEIHGISSSTVKKHILHIYRKLDVSSKVEFMKKIFMENML